MAPPRSPADALEPHEGAARLSSDLVNTINRFPDDNPNPVMRFDADGHLIYANPASAGILKALGVAVGDALPAETIARFEAVAPSRGFVEFVADNRTFAVWPVPIVDLDFTNLYGMDVTAERAIVKFPDQNPNPVFRIDWDGTLVYANPASAGLIAGLGLAVGDGPPDRPPRRAPRARPGRRAHDASRSRPAAAPTRCCRSTCPSSASSTSTAPTSRRSKERERLARENERLLLNILPEPIAQRLRDGEPLIADRFDDVTLLFADIVEFTRLSSTLSPPSWSAC